MTIRHDSQGSGAPSVGSVKRPRKERTQSSSSDAGHVVPSTGAAVVDEESTGQRTKLKRSSMAARNSFQDTAISADITERARPSTVRHFLTTPVRKRLSHSTHAVEHP